jgi:hypothetical protein
MMFECQRNINYKVRCRQFMILGLINHEVLRGIKLTSPTLSIQTTVLNSFG